MEKIDYKLINESLYLDTLENGLQVFYLPKKDYNKTYALFTSKFGSLDTSFIPIDGNEMKTYPEGIAHFLEHKLFEDEDGDAFQKFGRLGAASNAFTSFDRTSYLFSASDKIYENLNILLDFVQSPYFTKESVEKEQGIIGQEIQMYQDDADWRLFFGLLQNLYPDSPLAADIAGTPQSISEISPLDLYENYSSFYHPSNMILFVTGNFDVEELADFVIKNQQAKDFPPIKEVIRSEFKASEPRSFDTIKMDVTYPKFALGLRGYDILPQEGFDLLTYRLAIYMTLSMLFGATSKRFEGWYNQGIIDDSFDYNFELHDQFHMVTFSADTKNFEFLEQEIIKILENYTKDSDFTEEHFDLVKKEYLGNYYQSLNSLELIANQFSSNIYPGITFFDYPEVLQSLKFKDLSKYVEQFTENMKKSSFLINPS